MKILTSKIYTLQNIFYNRLYTKADWNTLIFDATSQKHESVENLILYFVCLSVHFPCIRPGNAEPMAFNFLNAEVVFMSPTTDLLF